MAFLEIIFNIIVFLIVLTSIITIHELGHFLFAKRAGILIHEFSIGMGPLIYQKRKNDVKYSVRAIPLGGYVSMSGEDGDNFLIGKGSTVYLKLNEIGLVKEIILSKGEYKYNITGEVTSFDLYGKDLSPLYIEVNTDEGIKRFQVARDARYRYGKNKDLLITPHESSFATKSLWQRFLVLVFGPLMNFFLALFVLFIVALLQGKPSTHNIVNNSSNDALLKGDIIEEIEGVSVSNVYEIRDALKNVSNNQVTIRIKRNGINQTIPAYVTLIFQNFGIVSDTTVENRDNVIVGGLGGKPKEAGVKIGDEIVAINGVSVNNWSDFINLTKDYDEKTISLSINRNGEVHQIEYGVLEDDVLSTIGVEPFSIRLGFDSGFEFDIMHVLTYPFTQFIGSITEMFGTLKLLFSPRSGIGVGDLSGPVGIFSLVSGAMAGGFYNLLIFIAFLSVNIGLLNLLPIPALDGGRIIFLGYEAVTRKKIPAKVEMIINNVFFLLLMGLFVFVTYKDIFRLFQ